VTALYLVPAALGGAAREALPEAAAATVRVLRDFVAENPKSARAFLGALGMPVALRELRIARLDEHTRAAQVPALLAPLRAGRSLGLLSEAGCPAIADPGAALVAAAHREDFRVVPLIGPSAILLALMASGLEGQRFAFCGYLPREPGARRRCVRALEARSRAQRETQIFIETPYRNRALVAALLEACRPDTLLCLASALTRTDESVALRSIAEWRARVPEVREQPTVFLLQAA
jgi:16S rRNA (cytidine1402-2'-O)-methyltransferase